jgi:Domain of unknown function (DUF1772)
MLAEWKPAYKRGFAMQAPLAIIGFLLGTAAWWFSGRALFLAGALLMLANWPWTLFVMMPTNMALMAIQLDDAGAQGRLLMIRWNKLHSVRTVLAGLAILGCLFALASK